jgi:hypothetical protein
MQWTNDIERMRMMSYKSKVSIVFCLFLLICCWGTTFAATGISDAPVWMATSPLLGDPYFRGGNVYYGSVFANYYYTGHNEAGALEYDKAGNVRLFAFPAYPSVPVGGVATAIPAFAGSKAAVRAGDFVYCGFSAAASGNSSVIRLDANSWPSDTVVSFDAGVLESLATDGTYIYSNDYRNNSARNPIRKYSVDTLSAVWTTPVTIPEASRIRGLSHYNDGGTGYLYVADANGNVWEVNDNGTVEPTKIFTVAGMNASTVNLYQAVRYGNTIYAVADNGHLYIYKKSGSTWALLPDGKGDLQLKDSTNTPLGALYGIGINDDGTGLWVSSASQKISYWDIVYAASGEITLGNFTVDTTGLPVKLTITNVDTNAVRVIDTTLVGTTPGKGKFSVPDVVPGKYTVAIKPSHWLNYVVKDVPNHPYVITMPNDDAFLGMVNKPSSAEAYEFVNGDINGDNKVSFADYAILATQYNKAPGTPTADLNGSGSVNFADYAILAAKYNKVGDP